MKRFNKFLALLKENMAGFELKFKDQSTLMKIIRFLIFFNKAFMTGYVTTIGKKVYFPTEKDLKDRGDLSSMTTLAHEYVHATDSNRVTLPIFGFLYLVPQILAPFMLLFMLVHWALGLGLFLLFLAPLPAPMRMYYEVRGYTMSLFMKNEMYKERGFSEQARRDLLQESAVYYNKQFTSSAYYFMWPFGVMSKLNKNIEDILSEKILESDDVYKEMAKAFKESKS